MKKTSFIILAALLLPMVTLGANTADTNALQGDEQYRQGNYEAALSHYQQTLEAGMVSSDLYYNLGNTYYRLNRFADAILCYERALRLKPSHSDARENLELANSKIVDRITPLPKLFIVNWVDTLVSRISPASWRLIVLLFLALTGAAIATLILARDMRTRKGAFVSLLAAAVLLVLSLILLIASTSHFNARRDAIVLQPSVTVKSSPEYQSVDKLILHEGTKVTITESLAGWHKITLADGTTGWCDTNAIERI